MIATSLANTVHFWEFEAILTGRRSFPAESPFAQSGRDTRDPGLPRTEHRREKDFIVLNNCFHEKSLTYRPQILSRT